MGGIQGAWPGGPRRDDHRAEPRAWRLESLEHRADRLADGRRSSKASRRRKLVWSTFAVAALAAGVGGFVLGRSSEQTAAEVAAAAEAPVGGPEGDLAKVLGDESTKVIRNMWLSEIIEKQR